MADAPQAPVPILPTAPAAQERARPWRRCRTAVSRSSDFQFRWDGRPRATTHWALRSPAGGQTTGRAVIRKQKKDCFGRKRPRSCCPKSRVGEVGGAPAVSQCSPSDGGFGRDRMEPEPGAAAGGSGRRAVLAGIQCRQMARLGGAQYGQRGRSTGEREPKSQAPLPW